MNTAAPTKQRKYFIVRKGVPTGETVMCAPEKVQHMSTMMGCKFMARLPKTELKWLLPTSPIIVCKSPRFRRIKQEVAKKVPPNPRFFKQPNKTK